LLCCACSLDTRGRSFFWPIDTGGDDATAAEWIDDFADEGAGEPDAVPEDPPPVDVPIEPVDTYEVPVDEVPIELVTDPVYDPIEEEIVQPCVPRMGGECSLVDNCGCGAGMACRLQLDYECNVFEACVSNTGTLPTDAACEQTESLDDDPCLPGNVCLQAGGPGDNFCFKWCVVDGDCPSTHECTGSVDFRNYYCGELFVDYSICRWR
jgi:hypothetical protein